MSGREKDPRDVLRRAFENDDVEIVWREFDITPNWPKWDPALRVREMEDGFLAFMETSGIEKTPEWSRAVQLWMTLDEEQRRAAVIEDSRLKMEEWPLLVGAGAPKPSGKAKAATKKTSGSKRRTVKRAPTKTKKARPKSEKSPAGKIAAKKSAKTAGKKNRKRA